MECKWNRAWQSLFKNCPYIALICAHKDKRFYVAPYPGNAGDGLIVKGTHTLLARLGVRTSLCPYDAEIVLYPGGSAPLWHEGIQLWRRLVEKFPEKGFVFGPSTFQKSDTGWEVFLSEYKQNVIGVFARDASSYSTLISACAPLTGIRCGLTHDSALHLANTEDFAQLRQHRDLEHALVCFRHDHESIYDTPFSNLPSSFDRVLALKTRLVRAHLAMKKKTRTRDVIQKISASYPVVNSDIATFNFDWFLYLLSKSAVIHTDRLHVMIGGSMLGIPIFAYSTSYGKLEAVWEHSLRGWTDIVFSP